MGDPKPVTCESESEADDVATELPPRGHDTPKKRSTSPNSTVTARRDRPSETQRHSRRGSESGNSTATKGSGDSPNVRRAPSVKEPGSMPPPPPPEFVSASPTRKPSRAAGDRGSSSSRSNDGQRSTYSAPARAPSTMHRSDSRAENGLPDGGERARREQREPPPLSGEGLRRTTSQRSSSRPSRAPSRTSHDMPPPPGPRARSVSANRAPRPNSFHAGLGINYDSYYAHPYASPYGSYERDVGPPPARSAYVGKGSLGYPVRPSLSVMPAGHAANYDSARVAAAHRAQTEYSTSSTGSHYSARQAVSYFPDQPTAYDASLSRVDRSQPPSPLRERHISARQPVRSSVHEVLLFSHDLSGSEDGSGEDDDDDDFEEGGKYMPRQQQPAQRSFNAHLSARGMPGSHHAAAAAAAAATTALTGYGTSPHYDASDPYLDDGFVSSSDYRSSVRSRESAGSQSTYSRRLSIASSDRGTKATSYSASSGSGGYPSAAQRRIAGAYDQFQTAAATASPQEYLADAERYMRQTDAGASHVRHQQPAVTQESLRRHNARAIEAKRSSRASSSSRMGGGSGGGGGGGNYYTTGTGTGAASSSRRSRTITAAEEQIIRVNLDTSAGFDVEVEGDTEGRPIKLVQRPGATIAQLIIGSGPGARDTSSTVYGDSVGRAPLTEGLSRVSARTGSTRGAVNGRRERARTEV